MRSGALRHEAVIFTRATTVDDYGDVESGTYAEHSRRQCSIRQRTFRERAENGEVLSKVQFELMFRYDSDLELLDPSAEVEVAGRRLLVMSTADLDGKRKTVVMHAEDRR